MGEGGRRPGEGRAADVEVFHRRDTDDGGGINCVLAMRDGGDVKDGIRLGQCVIAGVVAERAFVAQRLGRVNVAFDDEVGVGQKGFRFGQNVFKPRPTLYRRRNSDQVSVIKAPKKPLKMIAIQQKAAENHL